MDNQQLLLRGDSIRLLTLLPADKSLQIRCETEIARLGESPRYTAISYTWGNRSLEAEISLDGRTVGVTRSVAQVLHHLLSSTTKRTFWLDFLCIDQSNVQERNHQVALMGSIFSSAECVIAWLGTEHDESARAMRLLQTLSNKTTSTELAMQSNSATESLQEQADHNSQPRPYMGRSHGRLHLNTDELSALRSLCRREYWTRTWIIQEMVLARDVELRCGDHCAPLGALRDVLNPERADPALWYLMKGTMCCQLLEHRKNPIAIPLGDLILRYCHSKCRDVRDKIYALLSLADDRPLLAILEPDYGKPVETLYRDVMYIFGEIYGIGFGKVYGIGYEEVLQATMDLPGGFPKVDYELIPPEVSYLGSDHDFEYFGGKIIQHGDPCALRILQDGKIDEIRLQASTRAGEIMWAAPIDPHTRSDQWLVRSQENRSKLYATGIVPRSFNAAWLPEHTPLGYCIQFADDSDAEAFLMSCDCLLADSRARE